MGIPTVSDRIAQMVVAMHLEPHFEPRFDQDSYGYRPNKSALDAVGQCRQRCWKRDWVIDLDIKGFFDNIDHELLILALEKHNIDRWIMLHVKQWLRAPAQLPDGSLQSRATGTPQGGVVSPLLANIFLHYVFDKWIRKEHPNAQFERYADDIIVHCETQIEAETVKASIEARMAQCKLQLYPLKTKIVYCGLRKENKGDTIPRSFDFLGYTFQRRLAMNKSGAGFLTFLPAISNAAKTAIRQTIRSWCLHRKTHMSIKELANLTNPSVRGWLNYYGKFYRSEMSRPLFQLERHLQRWVRRKFARSAGLAGKRKARSYIQGVFKHNPRLFVHWSLGLASTVQ